MPPRQDGSPLGKGRPPGQLKGGQWEEGDGCGADDLAQVEARGTGSPAERPPATAGGPTSLLLAVLQLRACLHPPHTPLLDFAPALVCMLTVGVTVQSTFIRERKIKGPGATICGSEFDWKAAQPVLSI